MPITAKAVRQVLRRSMGTIGQLEALAGIPVDNDASFRFWQDCHAEARDRHQVAEPSGEQVFEVARDACYQSIAARVNAGELCLCN